MMKFSNKKLKTLLLAGALLTAVSIPVFAQTDWTCYCGNPSPDHNVGKKASYGNNKTYGFSWIECTANSGSGHEIYTTVTIGGEQTCDTGINWAQTNQISNDGIREVYQTHGYY